MLISSMPMPYIGGYAAAPAQIAGDMITLLVD